MPSYVRKTCLRCGIQLPQAQMVQRNADPYGVTGIRSLQTLMVLHFMRAMYGARLNGSYPTTNPRKPPVWSRPQVAVENCSLLVDGRRANQSCFGKSFPATRSRPCPRQPRVRHECRCRSTTRFYFPTFSLTFGRPLRAKASSSDDAQ